MGDSDNIIVGPASLQIDSIDVGFTQGGVQFRKTEEYLDVEADQVKGVMRKEITMERAFVTTTLLEATLYNLRQAMHEAPAQAWSGSALAFGSANPTAVEHVLTITGSAPEGGTRTYIFTRAIKVDEVEHMIGARDQASIIPIGFELLKDEDTGNRFGYVVDS